jgi:hypothetical protein
VINPGDAEGHLGDIELPKDAEGQLGDIELHFGAMEVYLEAMEAHSGAVWRLTLKP